ncbi:MAG TPA: hypothetical protein VJ809_14115 [Pirellulales bacterium]|nr:hypothetical protein [Pirellulales bacterium]
MTSKVMIVAVRCSLGCGIAILATGAGQAQWVQVSEGGGVHVRAPFVRVDVFEDGGVSVRAPFTNVDTPGRRSYRVERRAFVEPQLAAPEWSTAVDLAAMDDASLRRTLRLSAARLHQDLGRFNTRASWQRYLRLPEDSASDSSTEPEHEALARTLGRFRFVAANPEYSMITSLPSFHAMQDALDEMVSRLESSAVPGNSAEELPLPPQNRSRSSD